MHHLVPNLCNELSHKHKMSKYGYFDIFKNSVLEQQVPQRQVKPIDTKLLFSSSQMLRNNQPLCHDQKLKFTLTHLSLTRNMQILPLSWKCQSHIFFTGQASWLPLSQLRPCQTWVLCWTSCSPQTKIDASSVPSGQVFASWHMTHETSKSTSKNLLGKIRTLKKNPCLRFCVTTKTVVFVRLCTDSRCEIRDKKFPQDEALCVAHDPSPLQQLH